MCNPSQSGFVSSQYVTIIGSGSSTEPSADTGVPTPTAGPNGQPDTSSPTATPYPVVNVVDTEQSNTAAFAIDGDPTTVWIVNPDISPNEVRLRLDLGQIEPVERLTWAVGIPGALPNFEVWLSEDDVTWWNAAQVDTSQLVPGLDYQNPLEYSTRYIKIVIPHVDQTGFRQIGGISGISVWPALSAKSLDSLGAPVTPVPDQQPTTVPTSEPDSSQPGPAVVPTQSVDLPTPDSAPPEPTLEPTIEAPTEVPVPDPTPEDVTNGT